MKEDVVVYIAKANKVVAELRPFKIKQSGFPFGLYKGKIHVTEGWGSQELNQQVSNLFTEQ
ncbi:MAG: hypothetical protein ACJA2S_001314 [Cyclobacteriaceae bacterium]